MVPSAVLERFGAAVTSVTLEAVLVMVLAGMALEAADDNAGAVIAAGAALIVAAGAVAAGAGCCVDCYILYYDTYCWMAHQHHRSWLEFRL